MGQFLNEQVLPKAKDLHLAMPNPSAVLCQDGTGIDTMAKGYIAICDENNAAVARYPATAR